MEITKQPQSVKNSDQLEFTCGVRRYFLADAISITDCNKVTVSPSRLDVVQNNIKIDSSETASMFVVAAEIPTSDIIKPVIF